MWDSLNGVGKTPQVTADISLNPYSLNYDDVLGLITPTVTITGGIQAGSIVNVLNPNFDYVSLTPFRFSANSNQSAVITFDLGRNLNLRGTLLYFQLDGGSGTDNTNAVIEGTSDGLTFETFETITKGSGTQLYTKTYLDKKYRYLRITINLVSAGNTAGFTFNTAQIKISNLQTFY